jgi:hypothetical protein
VTPLACSPAAQPLHAASLYTAGFPTGDEGGNALKARALAAAPPSTPVSMC